MDGAWYYFEGSGRMAKGMIDVGGLHYYMDPSTGRMAAGQTLEIGGAVYEAAADGHLIPQGQEESGSTNQESASDSAGTASGSSGTSSGKCCFTMPFITFWIMKPAMFTGSFAEE